MSSRVTGRLRRWVCVGVLLGVVLDVAACGSGNSSGATTSTPAAGGAAATTPVQIDPGYDGPDKDHFTKIATPAKKAGVSFKVGFLEPNGSEPTHTTWINGARQQVEALGGELIVKDSQINGAKQASQLNELLAQNVDAIIVSPIVPEALKPGLDQAKAKGIPVVGLLSSFDLSKPLSAGYDISIGPGWDYAAYSTAKALAAQAPGARFSTVGVGVPTQVLIYEVAREQYWATKFGLKFDGSVEAKALDPATVNAATSTILSQYPETKVIMTFNDTSALAASAAAAQKGKTDIKVGDAAGGNTVIKPAIESGKIAAVYADPWAQEGQQTAAAAYALVTKQGLPLPAVINVPSVVLTKANVGSYDFGR